MAIAYVGSAYASSGTITPPAHSVGDLLVSVAWRTSSLQPGDPAGWTLVTNTSGGGVGTRINKLIAVATNDAATITNFQAQDYIAYSGGASVGATAYNSGLSTNPIYPALTLTEPGTSWVLRICWKNGATDLGTTSLTGYTRRRFDTNATSGQLVVWDSNTTVGSNPTADTQTSAGSAQWRTWTIEILATANKAETLTDTFTGTTLDTGKWTTSGSGDVAKITQNNTLTIAHPSTAETNKITSVGTYTLADSYAYVQVLDWGNLSLTNHSTQFYFIKDANNYFVWYTTPTNTLNAARMVATSFTNMATLTVTDPLWVKIREASGTTYWDYSTDGTSWTNLTSVATPYTPTGQVVLMSSTSGDAVGTQSIFDNFNTTPAKTAPPPFRRPNYGALLQL